MKASLLHVCGIGKAYRDYGSQWRRVASWFGFKSKAIREVWTLCNINFELESGNAIGIVGQNGAGKSTLLKIITGTMKPTTGTYTVNGRIAAILELGMGFHPDLTGRENAYHSAGLMGFSKKQIDAVIEDIEAFSEIGYYFDQPVRLYSSGMQVRVAFAVATAYRPEILIIDEALSVGDTYFQHKSFSKIRQFQTEGTTLLLVSHDRAAIQAICNRVLLLEKGQIIKDGNPEEVMDFYNALIADRENNKIEQITLDNGTIQTVSGTGEATVEEVEIYNLKGEKVEYVGVGDAIKLKIKVKVYKNIPSLVLGFMIKDRLGQTVYGTTSEDCGIKYLKLLSGEILEYMVEFNANLGVGSYSISTALALEKSHLSGNLEWKDLAFVFNVANVSKRDFIGISWLDVQFTSWKEDK